MTRRPLLLTTFFLTALACAPRPPAPTLDAMHDSATPHGDGPPSFTLALIHDDLEITRGERASLDVRIVRTGGFDGPVLIELPGLPDPCVTQAREARVGDEVTTLTILADVDGEPVPRAAFVVQASSLEGLRQSAPAHITVR